MKDKIQQIILDSFNEFKGTNEAILHASEEIEGLFKEQMALHKVEYEKEIQYLRDKINNNSSNLRNQIYNNLKKT